MIELYVDMTKEEREEQEKVWRLALQSIDQARHANAPGHEPNASKPLSGANLGKITQIITQLGNLLVHINEKPMERMQLLSTLQGALGIITKIPLGDFGKKFRKIINKKHF